MKYHKHISFSLFVSFALGFSACDDETTLDEATRRSLKHQQELIATLTEQPYGWKVTYFPNTDSLLFSDLNRNIREYDYDPEDMGYGGSFYMMKFSKSGSVTMSSDETPETCTTPRMSEYEVKQGMMTQLSFTTYNYLHKLINGQYKGNSDFYYNGKDIDELNRFISGNYIEPAREYIVYEPILHAEDTLLIKKAYENRIFFEQMENPQISIRQGDRIFFRSDYFIKTPKRSEGMRAQRYAVFLYEKVENPTGDFPKEVNGLGSGYVGTDKGLTFYPGIRLNEKFTFRDFERVDDKFRCEIVRVYSPKYQKFYYSSKHRHPEGEFTGMIAEITNEPRV